MIFSSHDSPFILVFTADARSVGYSQLSCTCSLESTHSEFRFLFPIMRLKFRVRVNTMLALSALLALALFAGRKYSQVSSGVKLKVSTLPVNVYKFFHSESLTVTLKAGHNSNPYPNPNPNPYPKLEPLDTVFTTGSTAPT